MECLRSPAGELKRGTVGCVWRGPQPATVGFHDRTADRESPTRAPGFGGDGAAPSESRIGRIGSRVYRSGELEHAAPIPAKLGRCYREHSHKVPTRPDSRPSPRNTHSPL